MAMWFMAAMAPTATRGADSLVETAVDAVAQLTDPARLALLPDDAAVRAQLGPALGWLHVARRHDVSPEAVIARALARNGLTGTRAAVTRESLLRNLSRADAWELFNHAESARALAYGQSPRIPAGMHQGRLARVNFAGFAGGVLQEATRPEEGWDFGSLSLRADDEPAPRPLPGGSRRRGTRRGSNASGTGNTVVSDRKSVV